MNVSFAAAFVACASLAPLSVPAQPVLAPPATPAPVLAPIRSLRPDSPFCTRLVVHANAAIAAALRNDETIGALLRALRQTGYAAQQGQGDPDRVTGLFDVDRLATALRVTSSGAAGEIARLRDLAKAPDFATGPALGGFADALASVLARQGKLGADLSALTSGSASRLQTRHVGEFGGHENSPGVFGPSSSRLSEILGSDASDDGAVPVAWTARRIADDVANRIPAISTDETHAAEREMGALSGC